MAKAKKKTSFIEFIGQVRSELRKISWPSKKETTASTISVFFMVVLAAVFLYLSDQAIAMLVRLVMSLGMDL